MSDDVHLFRDSASRFDAVEPRLDDRQMLMIAYGAIKAATRVERPNLDAIVTLIEAHIWPNHNPSK
jgi:hypothetical protein